MSAQTDAQRHEPTRDEKRKAAAALAALIASERTARRHLRDAAHAAVTQAIAHGTTDPHEQAHRAVAALSAGLATAIAATQRAARDAAHGRLLDEVRDATVRPLHVPHGDARADKVRAATAAASFAAAWGAASVASLRTGSALTTGAATGLVTSLAYRLDRIGTTETAHAYNDEHAHGLGFVARVVRRLRLPLLVMKRWDASLDERTCRVCAALDGKLAPALSGFPHGLRPGAVHVNCRCIETTVILPGSAAAGALLH